MSTLFEKYDVNIHMHKSIEPYQEYIEPSREQELKHNITYSSWFDSIEELQECIKSKTFFIAPHTAEGIGMLFLEAMAMWRVIIAHNEATMNEYIKHGKTVYLFDINNPEPLILKNIDCMRKAIYEYAKAGYDNWESYKCKIIEFISCENKCFDNT